MNPSDPGQGLVFFPHDLHTSRFFSGATTLVQLTDSEYERIIFPGQTSPAVF
jgi:hypothetical protein